MNRFENSKHRLEVLMTEVDDFDPDDADAKTRSNLGKALALVADEMVKLSLEKAHKLRNMAIDVLEGN